VIGAVLVLIVLFLFLMNLRTTFITLTAIPLSLVITTLVFRIAGMLTGTALSINVMTLGGIAVAMGELVDDAIVDVENIYRRLKENNAQPHPLPALRVVYEASREIRSASVFGTAVVILVFMPLFALSGVEGRLFVPLGVAYIVSILASPLLGLMKEREARWAQVRHRLASRGIRNDPFSAQDIARESRESAYSATGATAAGVIRPGSAAARVQAGAPLPQGAPRGRKEKGKKRR
jgi:hypothetical protein